MLGVDIAFDAIPWFWLDKSDLPLDVAGLFGSIRQTNRRDFGPTGGIVFQGDDLGGCLPVGGFGPRNAFAAELKRL